MTWRSKFDYVRTAVLKRDGFRCRWCFEDYKLHTHHKIPLRYGGQNNHDNLITLCPKCHRLAEWRLWQIFGMMPTRVRFHNFKIFRFKQWFSPEFSQKHAFR